MNKAFLVAALLMSLWAGAQSKAEAAVLGAVEAVHAAVFVNKDSAALDRLLAPEVTYGHSGGKLEDRAQTVRAVGRNTSTYTGIAMGPVSVLLQGKTAVTRYLLTGTESKADGTKTELKLNILQVWIKERKTWKMMARQAVKIS
ncbi:MAG: nuclear transport factor 2 family protein [Chitinophagaceae bacterium]|nr:MAG: nuclear transport factor 2 family protein [Chitinophagaceae bacterium]